MAQKGAVGASRIFNNNVNSSLPYDNKDPNKQTLDLSYDLNNQQNAIVIKWMQEKGVKELNLDTIQQHVDRWFGFNNSTDTNQMSDFWQMSHEVKQINNSGCRGYLSYYDGGQVTIPLGSQEGAPDTTQQVDIKPKKKSSQDIQKNSFFGKKQYSNTPLNSKEALPPIDSGKTKQHDINKKNDIEPNNEYSQNIDIIDSTKSSLCLDYEKMVNSKKNSFIGKKRYSEGGIDKDVLKLIDGLKTTPPEITSNNIMGDTTREKITFKTFNDAFRRNKDQFSKLVKQINNGQAELFINKEGQQVNSMIKDLIRQDVNYNNFDAFKILVDTYSEEWWIKLANAT